MATFDITTRVSVDLSSLGIHDFTDSDAEVNAKVEELWRDLLAHIATVRGVHLERGGLRANLARSALSPVDVQVMPIPEDSPLAMKREVINLSYF